MQLITILLFAVSALTLLTGASVLFGATKHVRVSGAWFFVATLGAAIWSVAIAKFMTLPESNSALAPLLVVGIISGITLTDVALIGYTSWLSQKHGKLLTLGFAFFGVVLVALLAFNPELFYSDIAFNFDYNQIFVNHGWYFYALIVYFALISVVFTSALAETAKKTKNKGAKTGLQIFRAGLSLGGILALIFDLILITSKPGLVWIGPMAVSISIITFYYSVIKYRILALQGTWMNILSYIILIAAGIIIYTLAFYAVFASIFRISSPSAEILNLNFIMAAIILCLMPAISEVSSMLKTFLPTKTIDVGYVAKKLNHLQKDNIDLKELAGFLAQQLKFDYVGFLIDGHIYGSKNLTLSAEDLHTIKKLKAPKHGIWQEYDKSTTADAQISRVAVLENSKSEPFGQILIGRSSGGHLLMRRDFIEIEMLINLAAIAIDGEKAL